MKSNKKSKDRPRLPNTSNTKFCSIVVVWPEYQWQILAPNSTSRLGELGWTYGIENSTSRIVDPTFLFDSFTHYKPILHRLATMHNTADRQTDRTIEIGRLCYSIDGLKSNWGFCAFDHFWFVFLFINQNASIITVLTSSVAISEKVMRRQQQYLIKFIMCQS